MLQWGTYCNIGDIGKWSTMCFCYMTLHEQFENLVLNSWSFTISFFPMMMSSHVGGLARGLCGWFLRQGGRFWRQSLPWFHRQHTAPIPSPVPTLSSPTADSISSKPTPTHASGETHEKFPHVQFSWIIRPILDFLIFLCKLGHQKCKQTKGVHPGHRN